LIASTALVVEKVRAQVLGVAKERQVVLALFRQQAAFDLHPTLPHTV